MNDYDPTDASASESTPAATPLRARRSHAKWFLSKKKGMAIAAGVALAVIGFAGTSVASALPTAATPSATPTDGPAAGPAAGGTTGIVATTSTSGFTLTTATGVKVTVNETSTTKYEKGTKHATEKAVKVDESVLVLGTVDSATIEATQVTVQPHGDGGAAAAEAAGVIPFQQGTPSPDKSVGRIPDYTEGEGTIISGTAADKAVKAAQAVVPGGVNDRVVELNDGEYEVHNISVNWPHHVFVNKDFKVVGWN
ncbi:hypothetical protein [Streptomyces pseudovenezuelae]|uniref:DUF5666 domain-containing protein n=1 Tax=Streptomyces pseudovenezuelae TaxID=67350 RepID=A0ABT6LD68_9ACTN|nr:hypothetical protein [Streptomyces pseudovenezuelae]MDH6214246.1 hypothetical protein [Streptomyces pseudovenezuelae]